MTDTITISAGRPSRQGDEADFAGPDGTYMVTLSSVSAPITEPSTIVDPRNPNKSTYTYRMWTLAIDGGEFDGQVIDVRASAESSGPKSKQFGLVAAFTGKTPPVGVTLDIQKHLVGRQALASILTNEKGYPYVEKVMAAPAAAPATAPAAAPAPAPNPPAPISPEAPGEHAEAVASLDDLPF